MKTRFSTLDIIAAIPEIQERLQGLRVVNVYDVDNKTYLIKLAKPDMKATLLIESGNRIHMTDFEWPKNMTPSGFTMKLRKHIRSRRMEKIQQLGIDRIIDIQFGSGEAAYHVILELYDRGNLVLTDFEYNILNILRPRTDESQDVRFAVREKYPVETARQPEGLIGEERLRGILMAAKEGDNLRKILNPHLVYGPAVLDHCLRRSGLKDNAQIGKQFRPTDGDDFQKLLSALKEAEELLNTSRNHRGKGYIIQKQEKKPGTVEEGEDQFMFTNIEFHPVRFTQHENSPIQEYDSFNQAVDDFFSKLGTQKLDLKALQLEKTALKKLDNVKKDHEKRLGQLQKEQELDMRKAELIEINLPLVERALTIVRSAVANQIDWTEINGIVKEAQAQGDPVACAIRALKLDTNHFTLMLKDPYIDEDEEDGSGKPVKVDIDLSLSAYANARRYFDQKRYAAKKEQKTIDASSKALKSAEKKTKQTLKDVATVVKINKARKTHWFEKFLWFISSENYIVVGGRDQQQNEFIVKKHLRAGDIYVHADLHGASSVVIKNPSGEPVPPKTLNEAGTMAVCNSAAWDAKVVTSAWWVYHHQVSKTAPTGEYLTTGSFMIRGKKNFLPPCYLVYGFGIMFKVDEDSYHRHKDERKVRTTEDAESIIGDAESEVSEPSQELDSGSINSESEEESQEGSELGGDQEEDRDTAATLENSVSAADSQQSVGENKTDNLSGSGDASSVKDMQDGVTEEGKESSEDEEEEMEFPDTSISLQHVKGDKFTLQRFPSNSTTASAEDGEMQDGADDDDDHDDAAGVKKQVGRLSAKQRREMKKKARMERLGEEAEQLNDEDAGGDNRPSGGSKKKGEKGMQNQPDAPQPKRGQKSKMKKIRSKYADQDEEERQLRMDILASAGAQKEEKKKGKKSKQKQQQMKQNQAGRPASGVKQGGKPPGKPQIQGVAPGGATSSQAAGETELEGKMQQLDIKEGENVKVKVKEEDKKAEGGTEEAVEEEDQSQATDDVNLLTSLTGIPDAEDSLLYCIPVCGPYSSLLQYKYKVKLIPGSTKRGKACKLAMNVFMHDKTSTNTEKDLLRVVKDTDVSRNMPGKVKVAAQGVNKGKMKGK